MPKLSRFALVFLLSCSSSVAKQELAGEYSIHGSSVEDTLTLASDGSYVHMVAMAGRPNIVERGLWDFEAPKPDDALRVTFHDFVFHVDIDFPSSAKGLWPAVVSKRWGKIRLEINDDMGMYYEKR